MPHIPDTQATAALLVRSRLALNLTQIELANMLGVARRTVGRWEGCESTPSVGELRQVARAVHPKDAALAAGLAAEGGTTLEALGLVTPAPSAAHAPQGAVTPNDRPFPPVELMIDSVVHVAAKALDEHDGRGDSTSMVRAVLLAAFARARGLGLTVNEVENALAQSGKPTEMAGRESPKGASRSAGK